MELSKRIMEDFENYCKKNSITGKSKEEKLEKLKKMILKYAYEPGEAIGIIAAQSISEPATQMSIDAEEKIILKRKETIRIAQIGEFVDRTLESLGSPAEDGWEVADISAQNILVPSITENEKIAWKRVLAVSRHAAPQHLLKLRTASGREIVATDSHSFVIRKENKVVAVAGYSLKKGDRIPSLKFLPENCITHIKTGNTKGFRKPLPDTLELNKELGWLFGIYLAEGNCTQNYVSISNTDENVISQIKNFANMYSFSVNEYDNLRGFSRGHDTRINSTHLSLLLKQSCETGSKNKRVPQFAYSAKESFVSGLLRGYFDGDGNVSVDRKTIRISSNSKELIDGTALLLARFGIFSSKGKGKQYTLCVSHKYAKIFRERIGFSADKKRKRLEELCSETVDAKQDFLDMISGFGTVMKDAAQKLGYPARYINSFTKRQKIGRSVLQKYVVMFEQMSKEKNIDVSRELGVMKQMAFSDVVWDEIEEITNIRPSSGYVYDLTVEGTETFTTFDGIITHNTMRSYIMASQSDRLSKVTQGLPRLIEIFDARKTFEKNMIIYVKPGYNTKEKAKEIASKIKELKVGDVITSDSIDLLNMRIELETEKESDRKKLESLKERIKDTEVSVEGNRIYIKPVKNDIRSLRKLKDKILKTHIGGVKGVENVIVINENDDWIIQTEGSNLKDVLKMEEIDVSRTRSNDIHQVHDVLGIEAGRNVILREAKETLDEQGLDVDLRHLTLLADIMTIDGDIRDIGRYGVSGKKKSVLARANFEETKKHLINASFYGETDTLEGVIENVLVGQIPPIGTGMVDLVVDSEKMKAMRKKQ